MDLITLENIISKLLNHNTKKTTFVWHGGEPLIAGLDFFKKVVEFQTKHNKKDLEIENNIQTNLLLLNSTYADFFYKNKFNIATSIDGVREYHDSRRVTIKNKGTYDTVLKKTSLLKQKPGAIVVLTNSLIGKEEEIYSNLKKYVKGFRIMEYIPKNMDDSELPKPVDFGDSMIKFYNIWKKDQTNFEILPISEILQSLVRGYSKECTFSGYDCKNIFGISKDGCIYRCIRAMHNSSPIGNVNTDNLENINFGLILKNREESLLESECKNCGYWAICNGGCPEESFLLNGNLNQKTYYCEGRKILFDYILEDVKNGVK